MTIEIIGLSISDIAAIVALIASSLIFYFGYSRTRKSEQVKISREIMDRINLKFRTFLEIKPHDIQYAKAEEIKRSLNAMTDVYAEIEYFNSLLDMEEIKDKKIANYCIPKIQAYLWQMVEYLDYIRKCPGIDAVLSYVGLSLTNLESHVLVASSFKASMKDWAKKYGIKDFELHGISSNNKYKHHNTNTDSNTGASNSRI
jgi:hypothetical protein